MSRAASRRALERAKIVAGTAAKVNAMRPSRVPPSRIASGLPLPPPATPLGPTTKCPSGSSTAFGCTPM